MTTVLFLCLGSGIGQTPPPPLGKADPYAQSVARVAKLQKEIAALKTLIQRLKAAGNLPADRKPQDSVWIEVTTAEAEAAIREYEEAIKVERRKQARWVGSRIASAHGVAP